MMGGAGPASAEPRRRKKTRASGRERDARNDRTAAAMTPTVKNRHRDVSKTLAQLCNCVPLLLWRVKLTMARTVGAAGEGEEREAHDVVAGSSLEHRFDVEQLMGHQAVAYVTKSQHK